MGKGWHAALIENRRFVIFFTVLVVIVGFLAYYYLPKQESPDVTPPMALIKVIYPGASPEDVDKLVTKVLEEKVMEVPGYKRAQSYSRNSIAIIYLELEFDADIDQAWSELRRKMEEAQREIPSECQEIDIDTDLAESAGIMISLSGANYSYEQLEEYADQIKKGLSKIDGISRVKIEGQLHKQIQVVVNREELSRRDLSLDEIAQLLAAQNMEIPSGSLRGDNLKINVSTPGMFSSLADIENTVVSVSPDTGAVVRLKDIADVRWDIEEGNYKVKQDGQHAILLVGYFEQDKNVLLIGDDVDRILAEITAQFPPDLTVEKLTFQPDDIERSVSAFIRNLFEGMILVIIVVFLGMGFRNALVASTAIPLSILVTFAVMYLAGIKVHEVSVASLIVALGILVDDAVVVIDAIQVNIDQGMNRLEAASQGLKRTLAPIFTSTLTTGAAFAPMLFVPGPAGEFLRSLPQVVIISVFASLAVATFVSPTMAYMAFKPSSRGAKRRADVLKKFYDRFLRFGMKYKKLTVTAAALILGVAALLMTFLEVEFFPLADKDVFYIDLRSETAADIAQTEKLAAQVEELLKRQPEVTNVTTTIGGGLPKFYITMPIASPSQDFAQIMVKADLRQGGRFQTLEQLAVYVQEELDRNLIGGKATVEMLAKAVPGAPIEVRIYGEEREALASAVEAVREELAKIPGTINIEDDLDANVYEFRVNVDPERALMYGITNYDVQRQLSVALAGVEATTFRKAGKEYAILVKSDIQTKEQLENLPIKSSLTGNKTLLKEFATVELTARVPSINKYDGEQAATVTSRLKPGASAVTVENRLKQALADRQEELAGVTITYEGEVKDIVENFGNLGITAVFALFAIYTVLMIQFRSFLQPLIIFLTIPLSAIGVAAGLLIFRQPLSFTALVGVVSLMGVVIKNAILLLEYISYARAQGMDVEAACRDAVGKRYRPIIMTATTTCIGLVPLALSGSELFVPMSVALMCGLLVSTFLTLGVVPVVYSLIYKDRPTKTSPSLDSQGYSAGV